MAFESLNVVVVSFPFTDRRATKRRPALIVSSAHFNQAHEQSILAMITSVGTIQDWREAGLNVPCKARFKLFTLDDTLIVRKLGTLSKRDGEVVKKALGHVLASN